MREKVEFDRKPSGTLRFLYMSAAGRLLLRVLVSPWVTKAGGWALGTKPSAALVSGFVKKNSIDLTEYEARKYRSFNDFFTRKIKDGMRVLPKEDDALIAPCDSALSVYKITEQSVFSIKGAEYSLAELLDSSDLAAEFSDGYCLVFRLAVDDYHRYSYFDSGRELYHRYIPGVFHTVQPVALGRYNFYKRNSREYTVLETEGFGRCVQVEVGAMMVGKISNTHRESFKRGEEKGMFEFGGSTVVLLLRRDTAIIDEQLITNTEQGFETKVKLFEIIGKKA